MQKKSAWQKKCTRPRFLCSSMSRQNAGLTARLLLAVLDLMLLLFTSFVAFALLLLKFCLLDMLTAPLHPSHQYVQDLFKPWRIISVQQIDVQTLPRPSIVKVAGSNLQIALRRPMHLPLSRPSPADRVLMHLQEDGRPWKHVELVRG